MSSARTLTELPGQQWLDAQRLYEHKTYLSVIERPSKATPGATVLVCEVPDKDTGRPLARAYLEHKAVAKPLSIPIDPARAVERAVLVLAGDQPTIRDYRTLNTLATALVYLWHYGDLHPRVIQIEREDADAAKAERDQRRDQADIADLLS